MAKKKAKVTSFEEAKRKLKPASIEDLMGVMKPLNPLGVSSGEEILAQMKASGDPQLQKFADLLERQEKGENVDLRQFSDM